MDDHLAPYYAPPTPPPVVYTAAYLQPPPPAPASHPSHIPYIPQPPVIYTPYIPDAPHDHVRTLFVAGLPEDVKAREIYNLFREFPGYESFHLRSASKNCQPFAFATFVDHPSAVAALHALNGMVFDLERQSTLHINLAKSNSRSKRSRTGDEWFNTDKKAKGSSPFTKGNLHSGFGSVHLPGMSNSAYNTIAYTPAQRSFAHLGHLDGRASNQSTAKLSNSSAPPCPTLFVANLTSQRTEQDLRQVFSGCPGFLKLKIQSTYGPPVAFVDFQDTNYSTAALDHLQGTILYSSTTAEGMHLEYAKSRMGMRRKQR